MANPILILVLLASFSTYSVRANDALADIAGELLKNPALGGLLNGFLGGGDGKSGGGNLGSVIKGLSTMIGPNAEGIDTETMSNIFQMASSIFGGESNDINGNTNFDIMGTLTSIAEYISQSGNAEIITEWFPLFVQTINSFYGTDAKHRIEKHAGHSWMLPPILENIHLFMDHLMNSELGRLIVKRIKAEKYVKIFEDETGKFSITRVGEMLENHSFRRHWIHMVTSRVGKQLEYFGEPRVYKSYIANVQYVLNMILKSRRYPKYVMFDGAKPFESIAVLLDYHMNTLFNMGVDVKLYIAPVREYINDVLELIKNKGFALGSKGDSTELSNKLADTVNLELIEPFARLSRAYRFVKKHTKCDRYVICMINQHEPDKEQVPGLKPLLSKGSSLVTSWFFSSMSGTPLMTYYNIIMHETDCQKYYVHSCKGFQDEELKVTTEYFHNEL